MTSKNFLYRWLQDFNKFIVSLNYKEVGSQSAGFIMTLKLMNNKVRPKSRFFPKAITEGESKTWVLTNSANW
jgi:hypothetical protein